MKKNRIIGFRLTEELYGRLVELSKKEERTLSNLINKILQNGTCKL